MLLSSSSLPPSVLQLLEDDGEMVPENEYRDLRKQEVDGGCSRCCLANAEVEDHGRVIIPKYHHCDIACD